VTDTGGGMPAEVIERATEPFFTTKPPGKGTGLGLSMIYGFAKQSDGHLSIYSEIGVGTTVRLYLPKARTEEERRAEIAPAEAAEPLHGGESILVVDDNPELRSVSVRRLTALGYKCFEAENGPAALAIIDSGERFDLLFTDVGLPEGILGNELAKLAEQRQPWLKVLFTTGYAKVQKGGDDNQPDLKPMLRKPYRGQELAETVRAILGSVP
jgi:CheY-like chemotaxis protein